MKIFYPTLFFLLVVTLTGLALATAILPYERIVPLTARSLLRPVTSTPVN